MAVNRRKQTVGEKYGESKTLDSIVKKRLKAADIDFEKFYHSLAPSEQKKMQFDINLEQAVQVAQSMKNTTDIDDMLIYAKNPNDRPLTVRQFLTLIREKIHPNLFMVAATVPGVAYSVMFMAGGKPKFVTAVGITGQNLIGPETEFEDIKEKYETLRKTKSRGWIQAIDNIFEWLKSKGVMPKSSSNEIIS